MTRPRKMPPGWKRLRAAVLLRDGERCTANDASGRRCRITYALEVDHLIHPDDNRPQSLRTLCRPHHVAVTAARRRGEEHDPWLRPPTT